MARARGHHSIDGLHRFGTNPLHQDLEVCVGSQRVIWNVDAGEVAGNAMWTHGIKFRLHDRISGRRDHAELHTVAKPVNHGYSSLAI